MYTAWHTWIEQLCYHIHPPYLLSLERNILPSCIPSSPLSHGRLPNTPNSPEPTPTSASTTNAPVSEKAVTQEAPIRDSRSAQRFVMNKVEKAWVIMQLTVFGAPLQKMKTLEATCGKVADSARSRHVTDNDIISQQNNFGMSWRPAYMNLITADNVRHAVNTVPDMAKKISIASLAGSDVGEGPIAAARGSENDAQHVLDQAILDYKHEASKRAMTTDDTAAKVLSRTQESRTQKEKRNKERKAAFEKNKRRRTKMREAREHRRLSADVQNLRAHTRIANAANASASLQRRQSEQFGILVNLFAQSKNLPTQEPSTPLPPPLRTKMLSIAPELLAVVQQDNVGNDEEEEHSVPDHNNETSSDAPSQV